MRIFIADADEKFLQILSLYLKRRGHEVEIASDALECTFALRVFLPDVVLLDAELLWADGAASEMGKDPLLNEIPVILICDCDPLASCIATSTIRFADWLPKPFPLADLHDRIDSVTVINRPSRQGDTHGGIHHAQNGLALDFQPQKT